MARIMPDGGRAQSHSAMPPCPWLSDNIPATYNNLASNESSENGAMSMGVG